MHAWEVDNITKRSNELVLSTQAAINIKESRAVHGWTEDNLR